MSWIKDVNELSPRVKNFIISMVCLIPFWYIIIYLFAPDIFKDTDMFLKAPLSFCFSVLWYLVSLALNTIGMLITCKVFEIEITKKDEDEVILLGGLDAIIYLSIAIFIGYWCKSKYDSFGIHYHFKSFLWLSFWYSLIRASIVTIGAIVIHKLKQK